MTSFPEGVPPDGWEDSATQPINKAQFNLLAGGDKMGWTSGGESKSGVIKRSV